MQTYNYDGELYHYGVMGMKWGVRRNRDKYITVRQASKNASIAGEKARRDAINRLNASPKKHSLRTYNITARNAMLEARRESIAADKAKNQALRAEKKAAKEAKEKAFKDSLNEYYKNDIYDINYYVDKYNYGKRGVERISKRLDKGMSSFSAHAIETGRAAATTLVNTGVLLVGIAALGSKLPK